MPRVKRGVPAHQRHLKVLKFTQGQKGSKHLLYRRANEARMKSLWYMYRDRRKRKGDLRSLWITRINAAAHQNNISYSQLMYGLKQAGVDLDRKALADLAVHDAAAFGRLVEVAQAAVVAA